MPQGLKRKGPARANDAAIIEDVDPASSSVGAASTRPMQEAHGAAPLMILLSLRHGSGPPSLIPWQGA
jgi:hypothetical protein